MMVLVTGLCLLTTGCALVGAGSGRRSECARIKSLYQSGEFKPAVDVAEKRRTTGGTCPEETWNSVEDSRARVETADAWVHKAMQRKREGNLLSARANLLKALEVYPRYYWVQNLLRNVELSIQAYLEGLKSEASYLEATGDLEGALARLTEAGSYQPGNAALEKEMVRLQSVMDRSREEAWIAERLEEADRHLQSGEVDEAQRLLTEGDSLQRLGARGREMLGRVAQYRGDLVRRNITLAREAEHRGDLDGAAELILGTLKIPLEDEPAEQEVVEFARLLGMKFYSAGKLSRAREIWSLSLSRDPGNEKLQGYVREVDERLESLDRIKRGEKNAREQ